VLTKGQGQCTLCCVRLLVSPMTSVRFSKGMNSVILIVRNKLHAIMVIGTVLCFCGKNGV